MSAKFKIGDPVMFRKNSSFIEKYDFDEDPLYIIYDYMINVKFLKDFEKEALLRFGYIYIISNIREDCGSGYIGFILLAKESQLKFYEENDPDVLSFYYDAREDLIECYARRNRECPIKSWKGIKCW